MIKKKKKSKESAVVRKIGAALDRDLDQEIERGRTVKEIAVIGRDHEIEDVVIAAGAGSGGTVNEIGKIAVVLGIDHPRGVLVTIETIEYYPILEKKVLTALSTLQTLLHLTYQM